MANDIKFRIQLEKLLVVEGKDEENFFSAALDNHLKRLDIQILGIGGKTLLAANLKALIRDPNFFSVTSIAIIRDADSLPVGSQITASSAAFQSVVGALTAQGVGLTSPSNHAEFSIGPPRAGVFIMPDGVSDGMLESLCLASVVANPEMRCVEDYFACCLKAGAIPNNLPKAHAHAWLASRVEPDKRVGEAAKAGYWPFASKAFDNLWQFLRAI